MENQKNDFEKYVKARRRVDAIKRFYFHLIQYVIITILIISFKGRILDFFISKGVENPDVLNWMEMNILAIPIIWGLVLSVMFCLCSYSDPIGSKIGKKGKFENTWKVIKNFNCSLQLIPSTKLNECYYNRGRKTGSKKIK